MSYKELVSKKEIRSVLLTLLITSIGFGLILPILPFYSERFGATAADLGMLTAVFAFFNLLLSPVIGKISDKVGRKKVLLAGTAGFVLSYLLFAFAPNLQVLFIARALEGLFAAGIFPSCVSLLSDYTDEKQRGKAMSLIGMTFSLGFILGPALGGLADLLSIQGAFFAAAALSAVNFISVQFQIKEPRREKEESRQIVEKEISLMQHIRSPLLLYFLASFMIAFLVGGLQAVLALYANEKLGFGAAQMGLIFTYLGFLIMAFQFVSGSLVNRFGEVRLMQVGMFLSASGYLLLVFMSDWLTVLLPLAILVMGNAFVFPSVTSLISKRASHNRGAVMGLLASFQSLGQFIGPLLAGFLYGFNPQYAFFGLTAVVWSYFLFFSLTEKT